MIFGQVLCVMKTRPWFVSKEKSKWGMPYWKFWVQVGSVRSKWRGGELFRDGIVVISYPDRVAPIIPKLHPGERLLVGGEIFPWVMKEGTPEAKTALYIKCANLIRVDDPVVKYGAT